MMNKINIVLDEGNGKIINQLYNQWNLIKNQKDQSEWNAKIRDTKFGTFGTIGIFKVLEIFEPKFPNEVMQKGFYSEIGVAFQEIKHISF